jgi:hypothetical protein
MDNGHESHKILLKNVGLKAYFITKMKCTQMQHFPWAYDISPWFRYQSGFITEIASVDELK